MSDDNDPKYLLEEQYKDASNLDARVRLHARFSTNTYGWMPWLFDHFDMPAGAHILELGCGSVELWRHNLPRVPHDWQITLTDFSPGMLAEARSRLGEAAQRFTFRVVDAQAIPYDDAHFDVVIANHMLYHVPDRDSALAEIRRVLKPGGKLYASSVGEKHLAEMGALARDFDNEFDFLAWDIPFTLENGAAQLERWFDAVRLFHFEDTLMVTEAEPIVDFVMSSLSMSGTGSVVEGEKRLAFGRYVQNAINAGNGVFRITKASGLFTARKSYDNQPAK